MKKLCYFVCLMLTLLLSGCAKPTVQRAVYFFDYTQVTNEFGVGFTESDAVAWDYVSLGSILVQETHGYIEVEDNSPSTDKQDDLYGSKKKVKKVPYTTSAQGALRLLGEAAAARGGDFILNLSLRPVYHEKYGFIMAWEASGMVVKRR